MGVDVCVCVCVLMRVCGRMRVRERESEVEVGDKRRRERDRGTCVCGRTRVCGSVFTEGGREGGRESVCVCVGMRACVSEYVRVRVWLRVCESALGYVNQ